jgi:hypothetical protein
MSKIIISALATVAAVVAMAGSITWSTVARSDGKTVASSAGDGYYISELRKADRLPIKQ